MTPERVVVVWSMAVEADLARPVAAGGPSGDSSNASGPAIF